VVPDLFSPQLDGRLIVSLSAKEGDLYSPPFPLPPFQGCTNFSFVSLYGSLRKDAGFFHNKRLLFFTSARPVSEVFFYYTPPTGSAGASGFPPLDHRDFFLRES